MTPPVNLMAVALALASFAVEALPMPQNEYTEMLTETDLDPGFGETIFDPPYTIVPPSWTDTYTSEATETPEVDYTGVYSDYPKPTPAGFPTYTFEVSGYPTTTLTTRTTTTVTRYPFGTEWLPFPTDTAEPYFSQVSSVMATATPTSDIFTWSPNRPDFVWPSWMVTDTAASVQTYTVPPDIFTPPIMPEPTYSPPIAPRPTYNPLPPPVDTPVPPTNPPNRPKQRPQGGGYDTFSILKNLREAPTEVDRIDLLNRYDGNSAFVFDFADAPASAIADNEAGWVVNANGENFPAVFGTGMSMSYFNLEPCAIVVPRSSPRAEELMFVIQGEIETQFVGETGSRVVSNLVRPHQGSVYPMGSFHFEFNPTCAPATFVSAFNSDDPGTTIVGQNLFSFENNAVSRALGVTTLSGSDIDSMRGRIPADMITRVQSCMNACNLATSKSQFGKRDAVLEEKTAQPQGPQEEKTIQDKPADGVKAPENGTPEDNMQIKQRPPRRRRRRGGDAYRQAGRRRPRSRRPEYDYDYDDYDYDYDYGYDQDMYERRPAGRGNREYDYDMDYEPATPRQAIRRPARPSYRSSKGVAGRRSAGSARERQAMMEDRMNERVPQGRYGERGITRNSTADAGYPRRPAQGQQQRQRNPQAGNYQNGRTSRQPQQVQQPSYKEPAGYYDDYNAPKGNKNYGDSDNYGGYADYNDYNSNRQNNVNNRQHNRPDVRQDNQNSGYRNGYNDGQQINHNFPQKPQQGGKDQIVDSRPDAHINQPANTPQDTKLNPGGQQDNNRVEYHHPGAAPAPAPAHPANGGPHWYYDRVPYPSYREEEEDCDCDDEDDDDDDDYEEEDCDEEDDDDDDDEDCDCDDNMVVAAVQLNSTSISNITLPVINGTRRVL